MLQSACVQSIQSVFHLILLGHSITLLPIWTVSLILSTMESIYVVSLLITGLCCPCIRSLELDQQLRSIHGQMFQVHKKTMHAGDRIGTEWFAEDVLACLKICATVRLWNLALWSLIKPFIVFFFRHQTAPPWWQTFTHGWTCTNAPSTAGIQECPGDRPQPCLTNQSLLQPSKMSGLP